VQHGADATVHADDVDEEIHDLTFRNHTWFIGSGVRYHVLHFLLDRIAANKEMYNRRDPEYVRTGAGRSTRANCPVYLGILCYGEALRSAAAANLDIDPYVTDLFQILDKILDSSEAEPTGWEDSERPFAYLAELIVHQLREIGVHAMCANLDDGEPGRLYRQTAWAWALATFALATKDTALADTLRRQLASEFLNWMLQLWHGARESVSFAPFDFNPFTADYAKLRPFATCLAEEFRHVLRNRLGDTDVSFESLYAGLDHGKSWVSRENLQEVLDSMGEN
jgi:hypothetical protein